MSLLGRDYSYRIVITEVKGSCLPGLRRKH